MAVPIFRPHYSISKMLQTPSLLPSSFSAFPPPPLLPPPPLIHPPLSTIEIGILDGKEKT